MNNMLPRPRFWAEAAQQIKTHRSLIGELLIYLLLTLLAIFAQSVIIAIPTTGWFLETRSESVLEALEAGESIQGMILGFMADLPDWMTPVSLAAGGTMGFVSVLYCLKFQKRRLSSMGLGKKGWLAESLLGIVLGTVLLSAVVALVSAMGGCRLVPTGQNPVRLGLLLLSLLGCLTYGSSLELLTRGYFAPTVGARAPVAFALFFSTFSSALMQAGGSLFSLPVANHLLLGLLLGIWVLKRGKLWGACAMHSAWLFAQNFLFDIAPAGEHGSIHLFELDADLFRPLLSGGQYGLSNSICTTLVLLAAVAGALALKAKDQAPLEPEEPGPEASNL